MNPSQLKTLLAATQRFTKDGPPKDVVDINPLVSRLVNVDTGYDPVSFSGCSWLDDWLTPGVAPMPADVQGRLPEPTIAQR